MSDLLALLALKGEQPRHIAIIGMVPHSLENRLGLTDEAQAGLREHGRDAAGRTGRGSA
ncbi:MAG: hypothetical protein R3E46_12250 [Sedimenticolaceae bacterium]